MYIQVAGRTQLFSAQAIVLSKGRDVIIQSEGEYFSSDGYFQVVDIGLRQMRKKERPEKEDRGSRDENGMLFDKFEAEKMRSGKLRPPFCALHGPLSLFKCKQRP